MYFAIHQLFAISYYIMYYWYIIMQLYIYVVESMYMFSYKYNKALPCFFKNCFYILCLFSVLL